MSSLDIFGQTWTSSGSSVLVLSASLSICIIVIITYTSPYYQEDIQTLVTLEWKDVMSATSRFFMEPIQRCPHIHFLACISSDNIYFWFVRTGLRQKPCPTSNTWIHERKIPNNSPFHKTHPKPTTANQHSHPRLFQRLPLEWTLQHFFQPHFSNLKVLDVISDMNITSQLAQVVMSSCPLLEKLKAPHVDALVVIGGKPWVFETQSPGTSILL